MKYTVNYFIKKFRATKSNQWCTDDFQEGKRKCVYGHCGENEDKQSQEARVLCGLFRNHNLEGWEINDGLNEGYPQKTPRARILAALEDIKAESEKGS